MRLKFLLLNFILGLLLIGCGSSDDGDKTQEKENYSQNRAYVLQVLNDDTIPFGAVLYSRDLDGTGKDYSLELSFNYDKTDPQKVDTLKSMLYTNEDGEWFYGEFKNGLPSLLINDEKTYKYGSYTDNSFILSEFDENNGNIKNTLIKSVKFVNMDQTLKNRGAVGFTYKFFSGNWGEIGVDDLLGTVGDGLTLFTTCLVPDPTMVTKAICVSSLSLSATADLKDITKNRDAKKVALVAGGIDMVKGATECTTSILEAGASVNRVKFAKAAFDCASHAASALDWLDFEKDYQKETRTLNQVNKENNITSTKKPVIKELTPLFEIIDTGEIITTQPKGDLSSGSWNVSDKYTVSAYTTMNGNVVGEKITQPSLQANYKVDITTSGNSITYQYNMNNVPNTLQGTSTGGNSVVLKGINQGVPAVGGSYQGMVVKENKIELTLTFIDETHMKANGKSEIVLEVCNNGMCTAMHTDSTSVATLTK